MKIYMTTTAHDHWWMTDFSTFDEIIRDENKIDSKFSIIARTKKVLVLEYGHDYAEFFCFRKVKS